VAGMLGCFCRPPAARLPGCCANDTHPQNGGTNTKRSTLWSGSGIAGTAQTESHRCRPCWQVHEHRYADNCERIDGAPNRPPMPGNANIHPPLRNRSIIPSDALGPVRHKRVQLS